MKVVDKLHHGKITAAGFLVEQKVDTLLTEELGGASF